MNNFTRFQKTLLVLRNFIQVYSIVAVTIITALILLIFLNSCAEDYLKDNPNILMSKDDQLNENLRHIREKMLSDEQALLWYELDDISEVTKMWDEFYTTPPQFESYTHFRSSPKIGNYMGVTESGYRITRDAGPWPIENSNYNIFFFGGSTSFGVGPYWATVASYLQDLLNENKYSDKKVYVYNFGRSGYMSTQENILFQNLIREGHVPDMVIFLDGLNDFCWHDGQPSSWQTIAGFFNTTNREYLNEVSGNGIKTKWKSLKDFSYSLPLLKIIEATLNRRKDDKPSNYVKDEIIIENPISDNELNKVINRYFNNIKQINAVSQSYGVQAKFVFQPIPTYKYDTSNHIFMPNKLYCNINSKFGYPIVKSRIKEIDEQISFIWAADIQEKLKEPLYIDAFHYTAPMSKYLAEYIYENF